MQSCTPGQDKASQGSPYEAGPQMAAAESRSQEACAFPNHSALPPPRNGGCFRLERLCPAPWMGKLTNSLRMCDLGQR